jgi:organic hydroperoxide reductase OsmC/OhrA
MAEHKAIIDWKLTSPDFLKGRYSREHTWSFDGGTTIQASPAPSVVPPPMSNPAFVDPEEAFVASVSSCHMLTFVFLAQKKGFIVESYRDEATGTMAKAENGVPWVAKIVLRPAIAFSGDKFPSPADLDQLHHTAHEQCYIANSIKTTVTVEQPAAIS